MAPAVNDLWCSALEAHRIGKADARAQQSLLLCTVLLDEHLVIGPQALAHRRAAVTWVLSTLLAFNFLQVSIFCK